MRKTGIAVALIQGLWFGAGAFLVFVAAPAAFGVAPSREVAGNVVGAMLSRWHVLALAAPLALLLIEWKRHDLERTFRVVVLAAALLLASGQVGADLRVRAMRFRSATPISQLSPSSPARIAFGRLHGISMLLMALQVVCAGLAVATGLPPERKEVPAAPAGFPPSSD
ncbi:MAG: DUF4149 domain-containing protein [Thermoanaerobaculia bacterium]